MPLGTEVGLGLGDIALDGNSAPPILKGHSPQFSAHVRCGQMAGWTKMPLRMVVSHGPGDIVLDGVPAPPPQKKGTAPSSSIYGYVYCGQTVGLINMPLGTEVGGGAGNIVLYGDPCRLWPTGWMDEDASLVRK